ncbi:hypothetical protein VNO80_13358 [Phaseolus coccineus]|uniref:Uncharacterized protein n=1 Tax=Phaseolus coccineus TaxID=3886 RepID=A0AAN9N0U2_PHACN
MCSIVHVTPQILVQPTHTSVQPTQALLQPTHTSVQPTQASVQPTHTSVQPTQFVPYQYGSLLQFYELVKCNCVGAVIVELEGIVDCGAVSWWLVVSKDGGDVDEDVVGADVEDDGGEEPEGVEGGLEDGGDVEPEGVEAEVEGDGGVELEGVEGGVQDGDDVKPEVVGAGVEGDAGVDIGDHHVRHCSFLSPLDVIMLSRVI